MSTPVHVGDDGDTTAKPPRNRRPREYQQSGHYALQAALRRVQGADWTEGLGDVGVALRDYRAELLEALGGEDVSPQRRAIVDVITRTALLLDSLDAYVLAMPSLVNKSKRQVFAVVQQRQALADSLVRHLQALGLDRVKARTLSASEWLKGEAQP